MCRYVVNIKFGNDYANFKKINTIILKKKTMLFIIQIKHKRKEQTMKRRIILTPRYNDRRIYLNRNILNDLFYFNAGGITYPDKNYYVAHHYVRHYSIQYILSGKGFIEYDGKRHELRAGDMFYLNAVEGISYGTDPHDPFTKIWVNGLGIFWKKTTEIFSFTEPFGIIHADDGIMEYFHKSFDIAEASEEKRELGMSAITALYNAMYDYQNGTVTKHTPQELDMSLEIKRYIDLHICDIRKLSEIAKRFELSERTVYSRFKNKSGMTPLEYINDSRLSMAKEQLCTDSLDISEIAERVGFSGTSYFCKVFRDKYGMTPQKYRASLPNARNGNQRT